MKTRKAKQSPFTHIAKSYIDIGIISQEHFKILQTKMERNIIIYCNVEQTTKCLCVGTFLIESSLNSVTLSRLWLDISHT